MSMTLTSAAPPQLLPVVGGKEGRGKADTLHDVLYGYERRVDQGHHNGRGKEPRWGQDRQ